MLGRLFVAKSIEVIGMALVFVALVVGLRDDDMGTELMTLGVGSIVFLVGRAIEPRDS